MPDKRKSAGGTRYPYDGVDLREHPEAYKIGRGEQGVFHAEPYKLLPLWGFKDAETARISAGAIYGRFLGYRTDGDFVGIDVARKYLQMGYTRARRYAITRAGTRASRLRSRTLRRVGPQRSSTGSGAPSPGTRST